jgi:hypothetical protein
MKYFRLNNGAVVAVVWKKQGRHCGCGASVGAINIFHRNVLRMRLRLATIFDLLNFS